MRRFASFIIILFLLFELSSCALLSTLNQKPKTKNQKDNIPIWAPKKFSYKPSKTKDFDLIHTKLEVTPIWNKKQLSGRAWVTLKPHFYPQKTLVLDAKGFDILKVSILSKKDTLKGTTYVYDQKKLLINLNQTFNNSDTLTAIIKYIAKPEELKSSGGDAIESDKGLFFIGPDSLDNTKPIQLWTQGETESASCWFPTIDATNQKSTQEISITVPNKFKTISNGILVSSIKANDSLRTDYWKMDLPHAPYLFMMAIGDFAVINDQWRDKQVQYYVEKPYEKYARKIFGNTPEMMEFFSKKLDYPYVWPKYASIVVRDYVSGAMENTSATVFMDALQKTDRELLDQNWDGIQAHELFHHWFGDLVTCESWANLALNESFANYAEYLWQEYKFGPDAAEYLRLDEMSNYLWEARQKREPIIRYFNKTADDMFDNHSYSKGGTILHMLRLTVGDEAFFKSLQIYIKKFAFKTAEIHDLRMAFEEVTGQDMNWFFNQWFLSPGHPELDTYWTYENNQVKLTVNQNQDLRYMPVYQMPIKVNVWVDSIKYSYDITIDTLKQDFKFTANKYPSLVVFDSDNRIVGKIDEYKTNKELIFQYKHEKGYVNREDAIQKLADDIDSANVFELMKQAVNDPFWKIREIALESISKYKTKDTSKIFEIFEKVAQNDPYPHIKALAIEKLSVFKSPKLIEIFEKGLQDSAWSVVSASLTALAKLKPKNADTLISKFENEPNSQITEALAEYFSEQNDSNKVQWFDIAVKRSKGESLYSVIQHFGRYSLHLKGKKLNESLIIFEKIARTHYSIWIRYSGFQALALHSNDKNIQAKLKDIRSKETSERLKRLYTGWE
ncbi:MAG: M1 family metallopeptidase [Bacteroidota bacterium]|nr:M1 family metallopeptidase [Bacteroidota bacterium]